MIIYIFYTILVMKDEKMKVYLKYIFPNFLQFFSNLLNFIIILNLYIYALLRLSFFYRERGITLITVPNSKNYFLVKF